MKYKLLSLKMAQMFSREDIVPLEGYDFVDSPSFVANDGGICGFWLMKEKSSPSEKKPSGRTKYPEDYERLWVAMRRYGDKKRGYEQFKKLNLSGEELSKIIAWISTYRQRQQEYTDAKAFLAELPHVERFLRREMWLQEVPRVEDRFKTTEDSSKKTETKQAMQKYFEQFGDDNG